MNTTMLSHPAVVKNIQILDSYGYIKINSIVKMLACGDFGILIYFIV